MTILIPGFHINVDVDLSHKYTSQGDCQWYRVHKNPKEKAVGAAGAT